MATTPNAVTIQPEDPTGHVARQLIEQLCSELAARYGTPPNPFSPSEAGAGRNVFLVAWLAGQPVACGAVRPLAGDVGEVKRMYVVPAARRMGLARRILLELERHGAELGYRALRLETGIGQPEALALYQACGYRRIPAYGSYEGNPISVCFEKRWGPEDQPGTTSIARPQP